MQWTEKNSMLLDKSVGEIESVRRLNNILRDFVNLPFEGLLDHTDDPKICDMIHHLIDIMERLKHEVGFLRDNAALTLTIIEKDEED